MGGPRPLIDVRLWLSGAVVLGEMLWLAVQWTSLAPAQRVSGVGCESAACKVYRAGCRVEGAGHRPPERSVRVRLSAAKFFSQNVSITWFQKVNSPTKSSIYC